MIIVCIYFLPAGSKRADPNCISKYARVGSVEASDGLSGKGEAANLLVNFAEIRSQDPVRDARERTLIITL